MNITNKIIAGTVYALVFAFVLALGAIPALTHAAESDNGSDDSSVSSAAAAPAGPSASGNGSDDSSAGAPAGESKASNGDDDSSSGSHSHNTSSSNGDDDTNSIPTPAQNTSNGGSRRGGSSGGSSSVAITISNVQIFNLGNSQFRVQWSTSVSAPSQLAYGTVSVASPVDAGNHGYQSVTALDNGTTGHAFTVTVAAGQTYYFRPVVVTSKKTYFGDEIKVAPAVAVAPVVKTTTVTSSTAPLFNVPGTTTGSVFGTNPTTNTNGSNDLGAAAAGSIGTKVSNFFKNLWNGLFSPICGI